MVAFFFFTIKTQVTTFLTHSWKGKSMREAERITENGSLKKELLTVKRNPTLAPNLLSPTDNWIAHKTTGLLIKKILAHWRQATDQRTQCNKVAGA